jgi:hypothetical protein
MRTRVKICLLIMLQMMVAVSARAADTFDGVVLTIPLVRVGTQLYSNVRVTFGQLVNVGGGPALDSFDSYDAATNRLTIPSVVFNSITYTNVVITAGTVLSAGPAFIASNAKPVLVTVNPLPDATVGASYSQSVVGSIFPSSNYTYSMDTLANGVVPTGMTLNLNGILSGTPFATGKADVQGNQIPNTYTFGVCATDTLTRSTTTPCPQTSITVNPPTYALTITTIGSGTVTANPAGLKYAPGKVVTLTATPNSGAVFGAWAGACAGKTTCSVTMSADKTVTASFVPGAEPAKAAITLSVVSAVVTKVHPGSASFPNSGWKEYLITLKGTVSGPVGSSFSYPQTNVNFFIDTWSGGYTPNSPTYRNAGDPGTANFSYQLTTAYDDSELPVVWKGFVSVQAPPSYDVVSASATITINK